MAKDDFQTGDQFTAAEEDVQAEEINLSAIRLLTCSDAGIGYGQPAAFSVGSVNTVGTAEHTFVVGFNANGLSAEFQHWWDAQPVGAPGGDQLPTGPITFNAAIRIVSTNTIYRLTFNGRTSATLDPGGSIVADVLNLQVAQGDIVAVRAYLSSGTAWASRNVFGERGGFTAATDLTAPGSAAIPAGFTIGYGAASLLGCPVSDSAKAVLIVGDSMGYGVGDGALANCGRLADQEWISGGGYALRALYGNAGVIQIALPGDRAQFYAATSFLRGRNGMRCTSAILEYGANDLEQIGAPHATLEGYLVSIANGLVALGISKVFLVTIPAHTTSTDGWTTTVNQTTDAANPERVLHNNWVRGGAPVNATTLAPVAVGTPGAMLAGELGHPVTGYFEIADVCESARDSGLWKVTGRTVHDAAVTAGTQRITSATANFNSAQFESGGDLAAAFWLSGTGNGGGYITGVTSATQVTNNNFNPTTTATGLTLTIGTMTIDGLHPSTVGHQAASQAIDLALL